MAKRRVKLAIELASAIGGHAADMANAYVDRQSDLAFRYVATANPEAFAWLRDRLLAIQDTRSPHDA
jgi:hypothetical protein